MSKAEIAPEAKFWNIIVYTVLFLALSACGSVDFSGPKRDTLIKNPNDVSGVPTGLTGLGQGDGEVTTLRAPEFPWQMWSSERDLAGQPITNVLILEGDHLFNQSRFVDALSRFQEAKSTAVTKSEQDAIIIREAGTRLALGNAEGTLRVLSNYFRRSGRAEESVTAPFSLLFAYSYGSRGDVEQALAWFSRTNRLHAGSGGYGEAAGNGVRALLRVPTTEEIHALGERWKTDSFVSLLIGQELRRRSEPDYQAAEAAGVRPQFTRFWQVEGAASGIQYANRSMDARDKTLLVALLPLSGQHSPLGQKVKNGIELAYLGQQAEQDFTLQFRDSLADPIRAVSTYQEFENSGAPAIFLGPLLSEPAVAVGDEASRSRLPVIVFSKRSNFQTGANVFRLGPTLQSQVKALLKKAVQAKGMRRFIVVSPDGAAGEFYRSVFYQEASALGAQVVFEAQYTPGTDSQLVSIAAEVELLDADGLFFPGSLKDASRFAGNLSREQRKRLPLLGLGTWDNPRELRKSQSILNGAMFVSPFDVNSERDVVKRFLEAYSRKFGSEPDFLAAQGFDAATLAIAARRQALAMSVPYEEALRNIDIYDGLTGTITVSPSGEIERNFEVLELASGKRERVEIPKQIEAVTPSYIMRGDDLVDNTRDSNAREPY